MYRVQGSGEPGSEQTLSAGNTMGMPTENMFTTSKDEDKKFEVFPEAIMKSGPIYKTSPKYETFQIMFCQFKKISNSISVNQQPIQSQYFFAKLLSILKTCACFIVTQFFRCLEMMQKTRGTCSRLIDLMLRDFVRFTLNILRRHPQCIRLILKEMWLDSNVSNPTGSREQMNINAQKSREKENFLIWLSAILGAVAIIMIIIFIFLCCWCVKQQKLQEKRPYSAANSRSTSFSRQKLAPPIASLENMLKEIVQTANIKMQNGENLAQDLLYTYVISKKNPIKQYYNKDFLNVASNHSRQNHCKKSQGMLTSFREAEIHSGTSQYPPPKDIEVTKNTHYLRKHRLPSLSIGHPATYKDSTPLFEIFF
uniref:DUF7658 domain-containing protein n=1 Tax=Heterorhabditis bacteriophora TaxID=37862 RepID=A0A1I7X121_HETBA